MQIACPKCSTTYVLDERVLPASGAPVQCTRCHHVFTAKPGAAPSAQGGGGTQIFGIASLPPEDPETENPPEAPRERTQIFGMKRPEAPAAPAPPPAVKPVTPAAPPGLAPAASPHASRMTQIFGGPIAGAAPAPVSPSPAAAPKVTQVFGSPLASPAPSRMTQIFGVSPFAATPTAAPASGSSLPPVPTAPVITKPAPPATPSAPPARMTQVFGAQALADDSNRQTLPPDQEVPAGVAALRAQVAAGGPVLTPEPIPTPRALPVFDSPKPTPSEGTSAQSWDGATQQWDGSTTEPHTALPPGPVQLPVDFEPPRQTELDEDPALQLRAGIARRNRIAIGALAVIAIGAGWGVGHRFFANRHPQLPPEARLDLDGAKSLLRKDDPASLEDAAKLYRRVAAGFPTSSEAKANLLVTLVLQLDDTRVEIASIESTANDLNAQVAKLEEKKATSDWQNRVNALIDQLEGLKKKSEPLNARAKSLTEQINQALSALQALPPELSKAELVDVARGQAVYFGVTGREQAVAAATRYRNLGGSDGWDAIALAEYAVNARVATQTLEQASTAIENLRKRDATFLRAYVLSARVAMALKRWDAASTSLDAALTLNPAHATAKSLQARLPH